MKVEPSTYYAHCDRIGLLVWQDQVLSAGCKGGHTPCDDRTRSVSPRWEKLGRLERVSNFSDQDEADWSDQDHQVFMEELRNMVDVLHNHPSIIIWTSFNEAWSQHRTMEVGKWLQDYDWSRLVNAASGGNFWPVGDIADYHQYPSPGFPVSDVRFNDFVRVVGEFGGHGLRIAGHMWTDTMIFVYSDSASVPELEQKFQASLYELVPLVDAGVSAAIYTQTTDVEDEVNGLLTYDRVVAKLSAAFIRNAVASAEIFAKSAAAALAVPESQTMINSSLSTIR